MLPNSVALFAELLIEMSAIGMLIASLTGLIARMMLHQPPTIKLRDLAIGFAVTLVFSLSPILWGVPDQHSFLGRFEWLAPWLGIVFCIVIVVLTNVRKHQQ